MKKILTLSLILSLIFHSQSLFALITLQEEEKIGREVLQEVSRSLEMLRDIEANAYINQLGDLLIKKGVSFSPFQFRFYLIKDKTFNAFSVPGGYIFLNTGLFDYLESEDELAAIMAHEVSHNLARHVAKRIETAKRMQIALTGATLAAILLGGGQAGQIVGITGSALAHTKLLSYSREDEEEADRLGFEIFTKVGFNPKAMSKIFEKLSRESSFAVELNYRYLLTHPLPQERLTYLQNLVEKFKIPYQDQYILSKDPVYFKRLRAKVRAHSEDSSDLILTLKTQLRDREDPWLRYTLAMSLMQARFFVDAERELKKALDNLPARDYFKLDLAELYFSKGNYLGAQRLLTEITFENTALKDLLEVKRKSLLARTLLEMGALKESYALFKALEAESIIAHDPTFFYFYALLCAKIDLLGESHFYFGKHYENRGDFKTALFHYKKALSFLEKNSKIYVEAENKVKLFERREEKKKHQGVK
ncbi:MAG: M48 family metalloprotease [Caldimicrobium sp.]|nr:M48 family metalloprotease [Caldimicrobium sp.]MCX7613069.1 M48 family metalloprotease [Caldimicrobium sp.]MDW8182780.1 M48 family metalloprotease [Caldimicrobium sp.]